MVVVPMPSMGEFGGRGKKGEGKVKKRKEKEKIREEKRSATMMCCRSHIITVASRTVFVLSTDKFGNAQLRL